MPTVRGTGTARPRIVGSLRAEEVVTAALAICMSLRPSRYPTTTPSPRRRWGPRRPRHALPSLRRRSRNVGMPNLQRFCKTACGALPSRRATSSSGSVPSSATCSAVQSRLVGFGMRSPSRFCRTASGRCASPPPRRAACQAVPRQPLARGARDSPASGTRPAPARCWYVGAARAPPRSTPGPASPRRPPPTPPGKAGGCPRGPPWPRPGPCASARPRPRSRPTSAGRPLPTRAARRGPVLHRVVSLNHRRANRRHGSAARGCGRRSSW